MSYGALSALARRQYAAVAAMRWHMLRHSLRTRRGHFELGARIFTFALFGGVAVLAGWGLGFAAYSIVSSHRYIFLPALFWPVFALWQLLPLMLASFQEHTDFGSLLRFPLSFGSWVLLVLTYGLLDISTLIGMACLAGIWGGLAAARPAALPGITLVLALFAMFNILLTRTIFAWIDRWLAQRRTREILGAAFLFLLLGLQMTGPVLQRFGDRGHNRTQAARLVSSPLLTRVQALLPPGLAAAAVESTLRKRPAPLAADGGIAIYVMLAAVLLGVRLRAEYRGENLGEGAARTAATAPRRIRSGWLEGGGPIGAIVEKELLYLRRSGVLLYSLAVPPFLMLVFGGGRQSAIPALAHFALPLAAAYSFLGLTRLLSNSLGGEGGGVQLYFLAPVRFRTILLAKNLVQLGLFLFELLLTGSAAIFRFGPPQPEMLAFTACWLLFAVPVQIAAGNLLSLFLAYRMTLTRMSREQGAVGNGLLSMAIQLAVVGVGAAVYLLLAVRGQRWLAALVLVALGAAAMAFWFWVAARIDAMARSRRETLIAQLVR